MDTIPDEKESKKRKKEKTYGAVCCEMQHVAREVGRLTCCMVLHGAAWSLSR
jgi:hypothetical protein